VRFNLTYVDESGAKKTPVIIHRAIMGSIERMLAILMENNAGKWPFWLSPRQAIVLPITEDNHAYARKIKTEIQRHGFHVEINDDSKSTLQKKIREAQLAQFNYLVVVGKEEEANGTVNVRTRDNAIHGSKSLTDLLEEFQHKQNSYH